MCEIEQVFVVCVSVLNRGLYGQVYPCRLCVCMISERVIFCSEVGKGATSLSGK